MSFSLRPTEQEYRDARSAVENQLKTCESLFKSELSYSAVLGWTEDPLVLNNLQGAEARLVGPEMFEIKFNSDVDGWKNRIRFSTSRGFAHVQMLERSSFDEIKFNWQQILLEIASETVRSRTMPDFQPAEFTGGIRSESFDRVSGRLSEEVKEGIPILFGDDEIPRFTGFRVASLIVERDEPDLEDLYDWRLEDVEQQVKSLDE